MVTNPIPPYSSAGAALRTARQSRKLSQQGVAGLFSPRVAQASVSAWECGYHRPKLADAIQLERQFGVPPTAWGYTADEINGLLRALRPRRSKTAGAA